MKIFLHFFWLDKLFHAAKNEDKDFFFEAIRNYGSIWNTGIMKQFLENYARAVTERDITHHLRNGWAKPEFTTYQEIKKLLDFIDKIENSSWQTTKKTIGWMR